MELGLSGKNVLVVGASKGIGRAVALAFAGEHCRIVAVARSEELLCELREEAIQAGAERIDVVVRDIVACDSAAFACELQERYGTPDIVVQNVGSSQVPRDPLSSSADWEYALRYNALAAIDMNRVFFPSMIERGSGKVIHISSISAVMLRGNPLYASAKAFLNAYVTTTGRQLAQKGIMVCSVMPGAVAFPGSYWDQFMKQKHPRVEDFLSHHQAAGRFGSPEEIADMVLFLAGNRAGFMHGANIPVDGGNM